MCNFREDNKMNDRMNDSMYNYRVIERLEKLEEDVRFLLDEMPCSHKFPHDEVESWDNEEDCEIMIMTCRNCGERVD